MTTLDSAGRWCVPEISPRSDALALPVDFGVCEALFRASLCDDSCHHCDGAAEKARGDLSEVMALRMTEYLASFGLAVFADAPPLLPGSTLLGQEKQDSASSLSSSACLLRHAFFRGSHMSARDMSEQQHREEDELAEREEAEEQVVEDGDFVVGPMILGPAVMEELRSLAVDGFGSNGSSTEDCDEGDASEENKALLSFDDLATLTAASNHSFAFFYGLRWLTVRSAREKLRRVSCPAATAERSGETSRGRRVDLDPCARGAEDRHEAGITLVLRAMRG